MYLLNSVLRSTTWYRGGSRGKNISFVGVVATLQKPGPPMWLIVWSGGGTSYRVRDMHVKFAKRFTRY